jgi:zinc protease
VLRGERSAPAPRALLARVALALALAAAIVGGCGTTGTTGRRGDGLSGAPPPMGVPPVRAERRLDNGIRVVIEENHLAPLAAVQVWVASGAADDPPAMAGAAHFYEHLVLRGGKRHGPGGAAREIDAIKGTLGAWTGLDETVYHTVVASPFLELGLDVLADAIANPSFDPGDVERVRKQALDEIAATVADPRLRANQALFAAAFAGDRHGQPVLGTAASVAALTPAALAAHFLETHGASAVTVVVVGDVDSRAITAVERAFGSIPRGREAPAAAIAPGTPRRVAVAGGGGGPAEIVVGFRTGKLPVKDVAALDLLAAVLGRGDGARMPREIVRNRQLADAVRAFSFRSSGAGLVAFAVTPASRRIAEAAGAVVDLALRAALEPVSPGELDDARAVLQGDLARAGEGPQGRARRLGFATAIMRDADDGKRYQDAIDSLGPAELQKAAVDLLTARELTVAVALPDGTPAGSGEAAPALTARLEAIVAAAPGLAEKHASHVAPAIGSGDAVRFITPGGVRVLVVSDGSAPLVSVQAAWVESDGLETPADDAAPAIAALLDAGTRTRSRAAVADEARAIGGMIKGFAVAGTLGLRADFLPQHLARGLALVADCVARPAFAERDVDAVERGLPARLRDDARRAADGERMALRLFRETLWPDTARRAEADAPPAMGRFALLDRYRRRYPLSRLIVAVVGNVDPAAVAATLTAAFPAPDAAPLPPATSPSSSSLPGASPFPLPAPRGEGKGEGAAPTTVFRAASGTESSAVIGYPTFAPGDAARLPIELLAEILGGEGGRLAVAFSDDRTLACRANARVPDATAPGYLAVIVTCPAARLDTAVTAMRAAIARVASMPITPDEVSRAVRRLIGVRAAALRTRMAVADALVRDEAGGLPMLSYRRMPAALARVATADVARAAQTVLDPKREIIAVVHPPSAIPALARTSAGPARSESER